MTLKILHTSDLHIGAKLLFLGEKAEQQREQIKATFTKVVDKALELQVDIFLIAGDVFDSPFPSQVNIAFFTQQLKRLLDKGIFVTQIPGNHDYLAQGCVYLRDDFFKSAIRPTTAGQQANFRFITKEADTWVIPELNLTIHASADTKQKSRVSPLSGFQKNPKTKFNLGLVHGSLQGISDDANYPINKADIAKLDLDYLALGDWHSTLDVSVKDAKAFYSGSPEAVAVDQTGAGKVLYIELAESKAAKITPLTVGSKKITKLSLDLGKFKDIAQLLRELEEYQGSQTVLLVEFIGMRNLGFDLNLEDLHRHLQNKFFYLRLEDKSQLKISAEELQKYPKELITGKFIQILQAQKANDPVKDELVDRAIQLGIKYLTSSES